jgi:hypothetical protein
VNCLAGARAASDHARAECSAWRLHAILNVARRPRNGRGDLAAVAPVYIDPGFALAGSQETALEGNAASYGRGYAAINAGTVAWRKFSTDIGTRPVKFITVGVTIA